MTPRWHGKQGPGPVGRRWIVAYALGLAILVVLDGCRSVPRGAGGTSLRVMSYNIQYGGGGSNLDRVAETIAAAAPDIVALQEVDVHWSDRSRFVDQAAELGQRLRMEVHFASIYRIASTDSGRPAREFGVALLTRFHVREWRNDLLTRLSTQEPNALPRPMPGLLAMTVEIDGRPVRLFNTHLDYRADPAVRRQQVSEMLRYAGDRDGEVPTIVFGDFNATPEAPELAPLLARFHDVWPAAQGPGFTFPAENPVKRIDYVLVSPHFQIRAATIPPSRASDHRPIIAELFFARR